MTELPSLETTDPWKILIVDDEEDVHDVTGLALGRLLYHNRTLEFFHAYSATEARIQLKENPDIAIALLDVVMEKDTAGLELVKFIRKDMSNDNIRLILRTGHPGKAPEESVTLEYDIKDSRGKTELTAQSLRTSIITALRSYEAIITIKSLNKEIDETQKELIYTLAEIAESRSIETGHHVKRVGKISAFLAEKMGFPREELSVIELAASMHDLGKLAIDDRILNKPGTLSKDEFEIIKTHSRMGHVILNHSNRKLLQMAAIIAHEHHENFDGTGYPLGLKGDKISLLSRIVALVDVYDALTTHRVYKEPWPFERISEFILTQKGLKFDPQIIDIFFEHIREIQRINDKINNSDL